MPVTALDGLVILITFLSAVLAMVRGLSRELLSLLSWILSGIFTYLLYKPTLGFVGNHIHSPKLAFILSIAALFLPALIILSIISMKLADMAIDSRIGVLDRTLGFVFGVARGLVVLAVAILFLNGLVKPSEQPTWIAAAKSKPLLDSMGNAIWRFVPENVLNKIDEKAQPSVNDNDTTPTE